MFYESQKPIVNVIMIINSILASFPILCLLIETIFRIKTNNLLLKRYSLLCVKYFVCAILLGCEMVYFFEGSLSDLLLTLY